MDNKRVSCARAILSSVLVTLAAAVPLSGQSPGRDLTAEEWRADLDTMAVQMRAKHWDLFHTVSPATFDSAVAALKAEVEHLTWSEILVEIARIAALVGDGHTRFWLNRFGQTGFRQLPLRLYRFDDGWHVRSVDDRHAWAAGRRVERIEDVPVEEAFERVSAVIGRDNAQTAAATAPAYLVIPEVLLALGIAPPADRVTFHLADGGSSSRELALDAISGSALRGIDIDDNPPGAPFDPDPDADGVRLVDGTDGPAPLWLADPGTNHVMRHLPEPAALYVRLTRIGGTDEEDFVDFLTRTYDEALRLGVERYILDVRRAWGGNNQRVLPAVLALVRRTELDRPGRVWVLMGRHTFSATTTLITLLDRMTHARFVGEPSGGKPNYYADARRTLLPRAGLTMGASSLYWQDSDPWDDRPWHPPDLAVGITAADYAASRDPVLEAALAAEVEEPLEARIERALAAADASRALEIFRGYRADPRRRWVRDVEAPPTLFRTLGDEHMVSGRTEAAVAAWTAGLETHPDPEAMRSRLDFVEGWRASLTHDPRVPAPEREALAGSYGPYRIVAEGERLVFVTSSGRRLGMIPLGDGTYALDGLAWMRIRVPSFEDPPASVDLVYYDGFEESVRRGS